MPCFCLKKISTSKSASFTWRPLSASASSKSPSSNVSFFWFSNSSTFKHHCVLTEIYHLTLPLRFLFCLCIPKFGLKAKGQIKKQQISSRKSLIPPGSYGVILLFAYVSTHPELNLTEVSTTGFQVVYIGTMPRSVVKQVFGTAFISVH